MPATVTGYMPMTKELTDSKRESTTDVLLNGPVAKLPSHYSRSCP